MPTRPQLLCLPPAGTGPSLYHPWTMRHTDRVETVAVSLPGREARIAEPLPSSIETLADQLADELAPRARHRYAMFGYSMGALLAYEVVRRWIKAGLPAPEVFFILGCNPPNRLLENYELLHPLESGKFWKAVADLGGTPREFLDVPEALELFEPIVRNDFRICENYNHTFGAPLACSAHVFVADRDAMVDIQTASGWRAFMSEEVTLHTVSGIHMLERASFDKLLDRILDLWPDQLPRQTLSPKS
ncbi:thioesterase [Agrobacterium vitis]|uniref:thioesterase II family protein n=1 Tax=Rhizobium/Agrobacterium group TaxID=227290 RepID=UPI0012E78DA2|nr:MULTISPECIES: alpha/beta fold hydrolase [Rhizobium/Agrobacterium group]MCF1494527.1 thioesterase [Allorhizobium ampelinum]MVA46033.1 thioesterase [Agrobacterium vitis]